MDLQIDALLEMVEDGQRLRGIEGDEEDDEEAVRSEAGAEGRGVVERVHGVLAVVEAHEDGVGLHLVL